MAGLTLLLMGAFSWACSRTESVQVEPEQGPPAPVEAHASVDKAVATTGDIIPYTIRVDYDENLTVEIPEAGAEIAGFRIIDVGRSEQEKKNGRVEVQRWYKLRADLVGSYILPPVRISYRPSDTEHGAADEPSAVETSAIFIEVASVLPEDGQASDIRDIKPLRPPQRRLPWLVVLGLVVLAAGGAVAAVIRWRRQRPLPPPPPPHEVAFAALDALRETDFSDAAAVRRFYFAISEVVRAYVEGRFGLNATDLTSEEICANLDRLDELSDEPEQTLRHFLTETDTVKFAAHHPEQEEIQQTYERALSFVELTHVAAPQEVSA